MSAAPWARGHRGLLVPAAALMLIVIAGPVLRLLVLSLSRTELHHGIIQRFAGLAPHFELWRDTRWWESLGNTARFTVASVTLEMVLGIAFALALNRPFRGRRWARAIVLLPWTLPTAVMALAWAWIFNDSFGVLNDLLQRLHLVRGPVGWLGGPSTAMAAMVVADVWKTTPFVALIVLAGLQSIPRSVVEAARIEGATQARILWHVVLPLLRPTLLVALAFRAVQALGSFDLPYVLTGGGPGGRTETLSLYAYRSFFRYLDFGHGAAIAIQSAALAVALVVAITWRPRSGARRPGEPA